MRHEVPTSERKDRFTADHQWAEHRGFRAVSLEGEPDPFLNVNTPADFALAKSWLAGGTA